MFAVLTMAGEENVLRLSRYQCNSLVKIFENNDIKFQVTFQPFISSPLEQRDILSELWSLLWELGTANNFTPWGWG